MTFKSSYLDEHNRMFGVKYDYTFSEFQLRIFDRWGEMIWESKGPEAQWDGSSSKPNGQQVESIFIN